MSEAPKILLPAEHRRQPPALAGEVTSIFQVLERAARDPNVDVEKMERLMVMAERAQERTARAAFYAAMSDMQPELPTINERGRIEVPEKNGKTGHSTPYALWEDINDAIRPVLHAHGFALSFRVNTAADGKLEITGVLSHREGHAEQTTITLQHDSTGSKNAVQAVGSSVSYGKRYTAMMLLNITTRGEDDDGRAGGARGQSAAAEKAIGDINAAEDFEALKTWRAKNLDGVMKVVSQSEQRSIVETYNRRRRALTGADSDFPGDRP